MFPGLHRYLLLIKFCDVKKYNHSIRSYLLRNHAVGLWTQNRNRRLWAHACIIQWSFSWFYRRHLVSSFQISTLYINFELHLTRLPQIFLRSDPRLLNSRIYSLHFSFSRLLAPDSGQFPPIIAYFFQFLGFFTFLLSFCSFYFVVHGFLCFLVHSYFKFFRFW